MAEIKVDPGTCTGCGECIPVCPVAAIEMREGVAFITEACTACGICVSVCPAEAIAMEGVRPVAPQCAPCSGVWVFAELRRGRLAGVARELVAKGRLLADAQRRAAHGAGLWRRRRRGGRRAGRPGRQAPFPLV